MDSDDDVVDDVVDDMVDDVIDDNDMYNAEGIDISWIKAGRLAGKRVLLSAEAIVFTHLLYRYDIYSRPLWRTVLSDAADYMTLGESHQIYHSITLTHSFAHSLTR